LGHRLFEPLEGEEDASKPGRETGDTGQGPKVSECRILGGTVVAAHELGELNDDRLGVYQSFPFHKLGHHGSRCL
jgi:hypothetical protein